MCRAFLMDPRILLYRLQTWDRPLLRIIHFIQPSERSYDPLEWNSILVGTLRVCFTNTPLSIGDDYTHDFHWGHVTHTI